MFVGGFAGACRKDYVADTPCSVRCVTLSPTLYSSLAKRSRGYSITPWTGEPPRAAYDPDRHGAKHVPCVLWSTTERRSRALRGSRFGTDDPSGRNFLIARVRGAGTVQARHDASCPSG